MNVMMMTPKQINELNQRYWADQNVLLKQRMAAPSLSTPVEVQSALTPAEFVVNHELTQRLGRLGLTEEQLQAIGFGSTNVGLPFALWSCTWGNGPMPVEAIHLVKPYAALKWLSYVNPPPSPDRDEASRLISETSVAPIFEAGLKYRRTQSARARKQRGKLEGNGLTMSAVVHRLATRPERLTDSARELWPHFQAALDELGLSPEESGCDRKRFYTYDFNDRRKKISFRQFANIVSKARRKSG
jgi:hypothetical protein